jgi:Gas vesicle synthesis protein GvpL/GvpF
MSAFEDTTVAPLSCPLAVDRVVYVYAFVEQGPPGSLRAPPDTEQALSLHHVGGISAVICHVPKSEYCSPKSEQDLTEPAWLMPRIRHHETVVERVMAWSAVFPMRFATLFVTLDSLTNFMRRHETAIAAFLRQVRRQEEWALRITVTFDDLTVLDDLANQLWPEWSGYSPGLRYLRLRQKRPCLVKAARERAEMLMPAILAGLGPPAGMIRHLPRPMATCDPEHRRVDNYALLVPVAQRAALTNRLSDLAATWGPKHIGFELSGPWPPYSFRPSLPARDAAAT